MEFSVQQHVLPLVVITVMLTIGMELRWQQFTTLMRQPRLPLLGSVIHSLSFPALAVALVLLIRLAELPVADATIVGMLLIAACPSGGFSNMLALMARVNLPLSVVLTFISSILSFLSVPLLMGSFGLLISELDQPVSLPILPTLAQLLGLVVLPIGIGMWFAQHFPALATRVTKPVQSAGQMALYVTVFFIIWENWSVARQGIDDALPLSLFLCGANLFVCYQASRAAGFAIEDRVTIALEGSIRNLAVALLIAVNVLERPDIAVLPTVYFLAVMVVAIVFAKTWRRVIR